MMMPPHTSLAKTKDGIFERRPPNRAKLLQARIQQDGVIQVRKAPKAYHPYPWGGAIFVYRIIPLCAANAAVQYSNVMRDAPPLPH